MCTHKYTLIHNNRADEYCFLESLADNRYSPMQISFLVACICNPSTWEAEAGGSQVQDLPWQSSHLHNSSSMGSCASSDGKQLRSETVSTFVCYLKFKHREGLSWVFIEGMAEYPHLPYCILLPCVVVTIINSTFIFIIGVCTCVTVQVWRS